MGAGGEDDFGDGGVGGEEAGGAEVGVFGLVEEEAEGEAGEGGVALVHVVGEGFVGVVEGEGFADGSGEGADVEEGAVLFEGLVGDGLEAFEGLEGVGVLLVDEGFDGGDLGGSFAELGELDFEVEPGVDAGPGEDVPAGETAAAEVVGVGVGEEDEVFFGVDGEGLGFFEGGESVEGEKGEAGLLGLGGLGEGVEVGGGEGVELLLLVEGGEEAVLVDAHVVPEAFVAVEEHAEPAGEGGFVEGVVGGGCVGGGVGEVLVGGLVVGLELDEFLVELADFDPGGVGLVEGDVVEGFEDVEVDFFVVLGGVVGGVVVDEESAGDAGERLGALFFELLAGVFEGLVAVGVLSAPVLEHADIEEVEELVFFGGGVGLYLFEGGFGLAEAEEGVGAAVVDLVGAEAAATG